jgi:bacillithiol system protein YtxJ
MNKNLKELTTIPELEEALRASDEKPVLLFKHSLTCPISLRAFRELETFLQEADSRAQYNLIIVQTARAVSNEAAERLNVRHESPQALLVSKGREVWNTSHLYITADKLREAIRSFAD